MSVAHEATITITGLDRYSPSCSCGWVRDDIMMSEPHARAELTMHLIAAGELVGEPVDPGNVEYDDQRDPDAIWLAPPDEDA